MNINSDFLTNHIYPAWKTIFSIWQNMKARQNWEKLGSAVQASIQKSQFSISSMNWEKLRSPARATFKNPKFQFFCELGKTWEYSLRPWFKSPQNWIYRSYVLIQVSILKIRWEVEQDEWNVEWNVPFTQILRIYQRIGKNMFSILKPLEILLIPHNFLTWGKAVLILFSFISK